MKNISIMFVVLLVTGLLLACTPAVAPTIVAPLTKSPTVAPRPVGGVDQNWDTLVAGAKKEGTVSVYALWRPETRTALTAALKQKYDINLEYTPFSRGSDLLARLQAESRAGVHVVDIIGAGGPTLIATVKPTGLLGPIEPLLVLPEVKEPRSWGGGKFPFLDKDKTAVGMIASIQRYMMYNTDLIKKGEITTYKDVLKPQYKGKLTLNDPTVTGVGNAFLSHLALHLWNLEETRDYLRQLIKQQEVVIQRDNRIHVESVVRGKFAIGVAPLPDGMVEFLNAGAPIDVVIVKEGTFVSPAAGAIAVPTTLAHPNAAKLAINWLLSKEGQTVFAKGFGNPSLRSDVSTEGFYQIFLAQPGEKLFLDDEESILFRGKMIDIAKQIIDEASK